MEAAYQYAWQNGIGTGRLLKLRDGRRARVLSRGVLNTDAGPDFSYARIEVDGTLWCGDVEIHVRASDWFRHHHEADPAYDKVVLHVVAVDDAEVRRRDGTIIPQCVFDLPADFCVCHSALTEGMEQAVCHTYIHTLDPLSVNMWVETLAVERLQQKTSHVADIHHWDSGDWKTTLFVILARAFGFGLNADPMETAARALPLNFAARHADNPFQLEAMLFGVAGMLGSDAGGADDYYYALQREYRFLAAKYGLSTPRGLMWKFARTRPQNFPYRRLAMLAKCLAGGFTLPGELLDASSSLSHLRHILSICPDGYWSARYAFGAPPHHSPLMMGIQSVDLLIINAAVPYLYLYGTLRGEERYRQRAMDLLEALPPERNRYTICWTTANLRPGNAFQSQALLHLRKTYCDTRRCSGCRFGHGLLQKMMEQ